MLTFNGELISTHCNCISILSLITLKMVTWVVETCPWLLCNKITFINPTAFGFQQKIYIYLISARNIEHIKLVKCFFSQQPVLGNCRYQAHGCRKVDLEHNKLQEHEKICTYQTVECYNKCGWRNCLRHLATHLREVKFAANMWFK